MAAISTALRRYNNIQAKNLPTKYDTWITEEVPIYYTITSSK